MAAQFYVEPGREHGLQVVHGDIGGPILPRAGPTGDHRHPHLVLDLEDDPRAGQQRQRGRPVHRGHAASLLVAAGFEGLCWWTSRERNYPGWTEEPDRRVLLNLALHWTAMQTLPILNVVILGLDFATLTEIAVLPVVALNLVPYRDLNRVCFRVFISSSGS